MAEEFTYKSFAQTNLPAKSRYLYENEEFGGEGEGGTSYCTFPILGIPIVHFALLATVPSASQLGFSQRHGLVAAPSKAALIRGLPHDASLRHYGLSSTSAS
jgi:hypothetical protein